MRAYEVGTKPFVAPYFAKAKLRRALQRKWFGFMIKLKRIYEKAEKSDGYRILVDRLWARGVSKEKAALDL